MVSARALRCTRSSPATTPSSMWAPIQFTPASRTRRPFASTMKRPSVDNGVATVISVPSLPARTQKGPDRRTLDVQAQREGGLGGGLGQPVLIGQPADGGARGQEFGGVLTPDVVRDGHVD